MTRPAEPLSPGGRQRGASESVQDEANQISQICFSICLRGSSPQFEEAVLDGKIS
jgi:hypothetical protein